MDYAARIKQDRKTQLLNAEYAPLLAVGTPVIVTKDSGDKVESVVRQAPWQTGSGHWIVSIEGIAGGYAVERVKLRPEGV